jgi:arginine decarboxylase-like protein
LVTGHYPSLADNPGVAPESDQTCFQQSDLKTLRKPRGGFRAVLKSDQRSQSDAGRGERPNVGLSSAAALPHVELLKIEMGSSHQRPGR